MARRRCAGRNASGKRCGRSPQPNGWCWMCDPNITDEQRKAARSRGGQNTAKITALMAAMREQTANIDVKLDTPADMTRLLEATTRALLAGIIQPRTAAALTGLVNSAAKIVELAVEQSLLEELERERSR